MKRKSKKLKMLVFKKKLTMSRYRIWKKYGNNMKIGRSTFFNIIKKNGQFGKAKGWTDMCDICIGSKQAIKIVNQNVNLLNECIDNNQDMVTHIDEVSEMTVNELHEVNREIQESDLISPYDKKICKNKIEYLVLYKEHHHEYTTNKHDYNNML